MRKSFFLMAGFALLASTAAVADPEPVGAQVIAGPPVTKSAFGRAIAVLDFDGDGIDEIAVGDPAETRAGQPTRGIVRIYARVGGAWQEILENELLDATAQFGATLAAGDFDDDGRDDLLIGAPGAGNEGGAVYLLRHTSPTSYTRQILSQNNSAGGLCGASLAVGDFDGDGRPDFAAGCPLATFDGNLEAGRVQIGLGNDNGSFSLGFFSQASAGVDGVPEAGDGFGYALAAGDFDCDFVDDLAIGVPYEAVGGGDEAGALHVLFGVADEGLTAAGSQIWHQDTAQVPGASQNHDHFGWSLAAADFNPPGFFGTRCADLAIGIPRDQDHDGGAVLVLRGSPGGLAVADARVLDIADFPQPAGGTAPSQNHSLGYTLRAADAGRGSATDLVIQARGLPIPFSSGLPGLVCIAFATPAQGVLGDGQRCYAAEELGSDDTDFGDALGSGSSSGGAPLAVAAPEERRVFVFADVLFRDGFEGG